MIKAVIFDMDGVLIDSEPLWRKAEIDSFQTVDISLTADMCRETTGMRIDEVVDYWYKRYPWNRVSKKRIEELIGANIFCIAIPATYVDLQNYRIADMIVDDLEKITALFNKLQII